jgi:hypothetical protein
MRGAAQPKTVGRLATGRLVLVEDVSRFAAYLLSLPDQQGIADADTEDNRFFGQQDAIAVSPFVQVYTVDTSTLSDENLRWLRDFGFPVDNVPMSEELPEEMEDLEAEAEQIKAELAALAKSRNL